MKLFTLAAAGLVALTGVAPAALTSAASAQRTVVHERTVVRTVRHDNRRAHSRKVCRNERRHGQRVRICRTVRY